jgi:hypothetical protein
MRYDQNMSDKRFEVMANAEPLNVAWLQCMSHEDHRPQLYLWILTQAYLKHLQSGSGTYRSVVERANRFMKQIQYKDGWITPGLESDNE